jgi:hypothetical protein
MSKSYSSTSGAPSSKCVNIQFTSDSDIRGEQAFVEKWHEGKLRKACENQYSQKGEQLRNKKTKIPTKVKDTKVAKMTCAINTIAAGLAITGLTRQIWR